jgi:hypothetical protein
MGESFNEFFERNPCSPFNLENLRPLTTESVNQILYEKQLFDYVLLQASKILSGWIGQARFPLVKLKIVAKQFEGGLKEPKNVLSEKFELKNSE